MVIHGSDGLVEFRFLRPDARQVSLAGDFNRWEDGSLSMQKGEGGWWSTRMSLEPGVYQFRYQADGAWFNDYAAFGLEMGPFGWNSVVLIEERSHDVLERVLASELDSAKPAASVIADVPVVRESLGAQTKPLNRESEDRQAA
jgi:1,4-alpha-glucan branching enzyme